MSTTRWLLLLAVVACNRELQRTDVEKACALGGQRVVVEGILDVDRDMRCVDRACDFSLRDNGFTITARVTLPAGVDGMTAKSFPGMGGRRLAFGKRTTIIGEVVSDSCRIEIVTVVQGQDSSPN